MSSSLNDKIARLAFDPSASEGEAIAAFLKLRARKVKADDMGEHTAEPEPVKKASTSGTSTISVLVVDGKFHAFISSLATNLGIQFYSNEMTKTMSVLKDPTGKWKITLTTQSFNERALREVVQAVVNHQNPPKSNYTKYNYDYVKRDYDDYDDYDSQSTTSRANERWKREYEEETARREKERMDALNRMMEEILKNKGKSDKKGNPFDWF